MKKIIISILLVANAFSFTIDKKLKHIDSPILDAHYELPKQLAGGILAVALLEGSNSRIGITSWKALEAGLISQGITEGMKRVFGRVRPRDASSPNEWGKSGHKSFPSGHVSGTTALVTPYILEYAKDTPWAHLLWALPVHQMWGRMNEQAHWQTDVAVGALVGFLSGYFTHNLETPLSFTFSKDNFYIGLRYRF